MNDTWAGPQFNMPTGGVGFQTWLQSCAAIAPGTTDQG